MDRSAGDPVPGRPPAEWNARDYTRLATPLVDLGLKVLERVELRGDERILDAGCGSGQLTAALLDRLPAGFVVGLDRSNNMLEQAVALLRGRRFATVRADLPDLPLDGSVDVVFSSATFHWVLDHPRLFAAIHRALRPGGRLVAQCGGGPNIARLLGRAEDVMRSAPFAASFERFTPHWLFADAETTATRLARAGFVTIDTWTEEAPITLADAATYHDYLKTVILRGHLAYLPEALQRPFLAAVTERAEHDDPPFVMDYWRLNMSAAKPLRAA
jgi:trans-aconitate 2-methyltransferase